METRIAEVTGKVSRRIIPYLLLLYVVAYIDRANISYAALEMNASLGFNAEIYGFAAGIFFIGYFLFEVPSNLLLHRFGARKWICRICMTWGIVVVLTGFVQNATQLYLLRFLLGVAEAGLFPGVILYLTYWFPRAMMARIVALFMTAIPVAFILGGPLSTLLIDHVRAFGLDGWRWMFIIEGAVAILLGPITLWYLDDRPQQAKWLDPQEKALLSAHLASDQPSDGDGKGELHGARLAFADRRVWTLSLLYFAYITGTLGLIYFIPQLAQRFTAVYGLSNFQIGLVTAIPYVAGALAMNLWGRRSDARQERHFHAALPLVLIIFVYLLMIFSGIDSPLVLLGALVLAVMGIFAFNGPFWAIPSQHLNRETAPAGIAIINASGNLGGFAGPFAVGFLNGRVDGQALGFAFLTFSLLLAIALLLLIRRRSVGAGESQRSDREAEA
ncbi:MFS transporter [Halotalea alkalilenta]|uniref:MFS transporter n=1 Tax=Halotalea alkalilenta TaxID=376489 RepID=UPI00048883E1|nr:MFS transporter [Halotalea alkalilenta]